MINIVGQRKDLTEKHRIPTCHGARFNICEHCGYDSSVSNTAYNVKYYHHFKLALCDRCVDKSHYPKDNYWEDKDAKKSGFPVPFKYPAPVVDGVVKQELNEYRKSKRVMETMSELKSAIEEYERATKWVNENQNKMTEEIKELYFKVAERFKFVLDKQLQQLM